jgi:hypothetical protein
VKGEITGEQKMGRETERDTYTEEVVGVSGFLGGN